MATNEQEAPPPPSQRARVLAAVGMVAEKATDTGPSTPGAALGLRVWFILVALAAIVAVGAFPLNVVGSVLVMALALTLASRVRRAA